MSPRRRKPQKFYVGVEPVTVDASTDRPVRITPTRGNGRGLHFEGPATVNNSHRPDEALLRAVVVDFPTRVSCSAPGYGQSFTVEAA